MTKADKPVKRETYSYNRSRPLIIELCPTYLTIREKGRRSGFTVTYQQIFTLGARNAAEQLRAAKAEARKTKKKGTSR